MSKPVPSILVKFPDGNGRAIAIDDDGTIAVKLDSGAIRHVRDEQAAVYEDGQGDHYIVVGRN